MTENFWPIWPKADFREIKLDGEAELLTLPDGNFDPLRFVEEASSGVHAATEPHQAASSIEEN